MLAPKELYRFIAPKEHCRSIRHDHIQICHFFRFSAFMAVYNAFGVNDDDVAMLLMLMLIMMLR